MHIFDFARPTCLVRYIAYVLLICRYYCMAYDGFGGPREGAWNVSVVGGPGGSGVGLGGGGKGHECTMR